MRGMIRRTRNSLSGMRRHPTLVAGFAGRLNHVDGMSLGHYLFARLPRDVARGVASAVLVQDDIEGIMSFERDGIHWTVDTGDIIGWSLYANGRWEGPEVDAVLGWLSMRSHPHVLIDAGANVGTTSVPFATAGYRVVGIEPVPKTFAMLQANVDNNGLADRIACVPFALAEERGEVEMWIARGSGQSEIIVTETKGSDAQQLRQQPIGRITVQATRLEYVLRDLGISSTDVGLVWADVQGSEASIIRGAPGLWAAGTPLYLEVDPHSIGVHEGIDGFTALVTEHFSHFVPSNRLPGGTPTPITSFRRFIDSIACGAYANALLIP